MALSVLVALMMLAVPLASSSNLFVDGGQTNSNGDAPVLGASTGYTVTFQLNADGKSLDQIDNLTTVITALNTSANFNDSVTWYQDANSNLCALVMYDTSNAPPTAADTNVSIQELVDKIFNVNNALPSKGDAYSLLSWKDADSGVLYDKNTGVAIKERHDSRC